MAICTGQPGHPIWPHQTLLWGYLKSRVYVNKPHNYKALKNTGIPETIAESTDTDKIFSNWWKKILVYFINIFKKKQNFSFLQKKNAAKQHRDYFCPTFPAVKSDFLNCHEYIEKISIVWELCDLVLLIKSSKTQLQSHSRGFINHTFLLTLVQIYFYIQTPLILDEVPTYPQRLTSCYH